MTAARGTGLQAVSMNREQAECNLVLLVVRRSELEARLAAGVVREM
jgi:hypothetical protein